MNTNVVILIEKYLIKRSMNGLIFEYVSINEVARAIQRKRMVVADAIYEMVKVGIMREHLLNNMMKTRKYNLNCNYYREHYVVFSGLLRPKDEKVNNTNTTEVVKKLAEKQNRSEYYD